MALRWRVKSLDHAEGYLRAHWPTIRRHGLEHGNCLHECPPRWEHLRPVREHDGFAELLQVLDAPFIDAAVGTADAIGLLPERGREVIVPGRSNHLQGDGTSVKHMTKVRFDDNGEIRGSRATTQAPRELTRSPDGPADTMGAVSSEAYWIRRRQRPPRPTGPSTVNGKTAKELLDEQLEALRNMSPEELAAFADEMISESEAQRVDAQEAAAWRRAQRYRMN